MNILVVGSGGREHALAWKIKQSPLVKRLVVAPGNPGMDQIAELHPVKATDVEGLVALARDMRCDLVVVGPETALETGLADRLAAVGIPCFGPTAKAARLETSKAFTKAFCDRHNIPTAAYGVFEDEAQAKAFLSNFQPPYVIKADGLAAGKGVAISPDRRDAEAEIEARIGGRFGGGPGSRVVIEEFMAGEEASLFALCDGERALLFGGAQDHKRAFDGDAGPNTGGMGTYSPTSAFTDTVVEAARTKIVEPTVRGMAAEGAPFRGVLYAGLMIGEGGQPRLVEYNTRFGDPECQVLMMRLKSDIVPFLHAAATGNLAKVGQPQWRAEAAVCVVMAARGYPDSPIPGSVIRGAEQDFGPDVTVFHAGTNRRADGTLTAAGGRVLNVCALGADFAEARNKAYAAVAQIDWPGGFYRTDIGWRELARQR
ncbi:phosphoribosylamine--glycine ligase [Caulobacter sp. 17J65-9]|uniref:phosphoribosylamine--glycine ligase n=1 Tax=Caulobacter sp. 17J65-9 TaxID=2709382 RepID=UPI0013C8DBC1|nr:phosphoribosylamine--glycine ligase [Caulobacter sp. 17J65-9]NEX94900.1 phosphoribosylamine--glycine ligase [Caulobacter sp. 17J65-9]